MGLARRGRDCCGSFGLRRLVSRGILWFEVGVSAPRAKTDTERRYGGSWRTQIVEFGLPPRAWPPPQVASPPTRGETYTTVPAPPRCLRTCCKAVRRGPPDPHPSSRPEDALASASTRVSLIAELNAELDILQYRDAPFASAGIDDERHSASNLLI